MKQETRLNPTWLLFLLAIAALGSYVNFFFLDNDIEKLMALVAGFGNTILYSVLELQNDIRSRP